MAKDMDEFEEEPVEEIPPVYEDLVIEEPEVEVALEEIPINRTVSETEEETPQSTDLQAAMRALLPKFANKRMNELLQPTLVSRIFPDNFIDLNFLLSMTLIEEHEPDADVDVVGIISTVQAGTSIGYEGRGRVDVLEIAGVAHEEEMEELTKKLGL